MSNPGALSKKELAEAGRRKLEEFKRKKQLAKSAAQHAGAAQPSLADSAVGTALPEGAAPSAQAAVAAVSQPSTTAAVVTTPDAVSAPAAVPAGSTPAQQAYEWHGSPGAQASSTAARAAAAGAAAAALEAALMGLPSSAAPADTPAAPSSSISAAAPAATAFSQLLQQQASASHIAPSAGHAWGRTQQQPQQNAPAVSSPKAQQAGRPPSPVKAPVQQSAAGANGTAGLQPRADTNVHTSSPPVAATTSHPEQQQQQGSSWLSLFGGRSNPAGIGGPDQPHDQQRQQGSIYDSLLSHSSHRTSHPSSPGQVGLVPPATAIQQAEAGVGSAGKHPMPWRPGAEAAATASQQRGTSDTSAADILQAQWTSGMPSGTSNSGVSAGSSSLSAAIAPDTAVTVPATAPKASSSYSSLADLYLAPAPAAAATTAASASGTGSVHDSEPKSGAQASKHAFGASSSYASLSDSYLMPTSRADESALLQDQKMYASVQQQQLEQSARNSDNSSIAPAAAEVAMGMVGIGSQQGKAAAAAGAAVANTLWGFAATAAVSAPTSVSPFQLNANSPTKAGSSNYAALADSYLQKATTAAAGEAAKATPASVLQPQQAAPQQHLEEQLEQQPNGNFSRPAMLSSLPASAAGAGTLHAHCPAEKQSLAQHGSAEGLASLGRITSITNSSMPGSGPPSTSGGLSLIHAHAESSQRSVERLKLLQHHIDELTQEKLELMRGLQQQARSNEALAEENRMLGEQHNKLAVQAERGRQQVKQLEQEFAAAAASMAALAAERDAHRAAATEAHDRANSLAAENVALENQLLEAKSARLRVERETSSSSSTIAKLEDKVAKLSATAGAATSELAGLQSERRILKARLMQAEARMKAAGLQPLPPLPSNMGQAEAEVAPLVHKVDAEVQVDLQQAPPRFQLPLDTTALPPEVLAIAEGAVAAEFTKQSVVDHVKINHKAAAVLAGLADWLPKDVVAAAEAAAAAGTSASAAPAGSSSTAPDGAAAAAVAGASSADAAVTAAVVALVGGDVWCEEARLAGSVVGLAQQLQDSWGAVLDEMEHERERNQQLQQDAEDLRYRLAEMQQKLEQHLQQPVQVQGHHLQQQEGGPQQLGIPPAAHGSDCTPSADFEGPQQHDLPHSQHIDDYPHVVQQHEASNSHWAQRLPVSVSAHSDAPGTPSRPDQSHGQGDAGASTAGPGAGLKPYDAYNLADYAAAVNDAATVTGSVVSSSLSGTTIGHQWDDSSTASSSRAANGRSWFGMFGRKNSNRARSALL